jgi:hypothetical protein
MKEKSSAPITGATSGLTLLDPTTSPATDAANAGVVAGDGVTAMVGELGFRAVQGCDAFHHVSQSALHEVTHLGRQAAHGAAQERGLRDHVVGRSGLEHADRHDRRFQRVDIAGHDRLHLGDDLRADENGVDCDMRARGVPPLALELDHEMVGGRHQRSRPQREFARRDAGIIVHAVDFLDAEAGHQPVIDHRLAAGSALLRRLEDHDRGP